MTPNVLRLLTEYLNKAIQDKKYKEERESLA